MGCKQSKSNPLEEEDATSLHRRSRANLKLAIGAVGPSATTTTPTKMTALAAAEQPQHHHHQQHPQKQQLHQHQQEDRRRQPQQQQLQLLQKQLRQQVRLQQQKKQRYANIPLKLPLSLSTNGVKPTPSPSDNTRTPAMTPHAEEPTSAVKVEEAQAPESSRPLVYEKARGDVCTAVSGETDCGSSTAAPSAESEEDRGRDSQSDPDDYGPTAEQPAIASPRRRSGVVYACDLAPEEDSYPEQRQRGGWDVTEHQQDISTPREERQQRQQQQQQQQKPVASPRNAPPELALPSTLPDPDEVRLFLETHRPPEGVSTTAHGAPCRVQLRNGLVYEGQLRRLDDMPHGWGRVTLPGGVVYEGGWFGGRVHGKGALLLPNGNAYWGSWAYGRKHGVGTFSWADGSRYDGYYSAGSRSGLGTLRYATGAVYDGDFAGDVRHGVGRLELPDGVVFEGEFEGDVPHGHGVFADPGEGGERFEGSWHRGLRSGGGTLVQGWAGREEEKADAAPSAGMGVAWYSGTFEGGFPHGEGAMWYGSAAYCGHVERGEWTGGGGRVDLGDGTGSFEGAWSDGLPRGSGRWLCEQDGVEVDCTFEEGYSRLIWPS